MGEVPAKSDHGKVMPPCVKHRTLVIGLYLNTLSLVRNVSDLNPKNMHNGLRRKPPGKCILGLPVWSVCPTARGLRVCSQRVWADQQAGEPGSDSHFYLLPCTLVPALLSSAFCHALETRSSVGDLWCHLRCAQGLVN